MGEEADYLINQALDDGDYFSRRAFYHDPEYYHERVLTEGVVREDANRISVRVKGDEGVWVPKKSVKMLTTLILWVNKNLWAELPRVSIEEQDPANDFENLS